MRAVANQPVHIAVSGVMHETNTFAPGTTPLSAFQQEWFEDKAPFIRRYARTRTSMGAVIDAEEAGVIRASLGLYTETMPGGMVEAQAFDRT